MAWKIEMDPAVARELDKLDPQAARRLLKFLFERLSVLDDPRSMGEALKGSRLGEFWKYRVGDYRIIARIEDRILTILVVRMATAARFAAKASIVFYRRGFSRDPPRHPSPVAAKPLLQPSRTVVARARPVAIRSCKSRQNPLLDENATFEFELVAPKQQIRINAALKQHID